VVVVVVLLLAHLETEVQEEADLVRVLVVEQLVMLEQQILVAAAEALVGVVVQ
jgi:hypothetical protein